MKHWSLEAPLKQVPIVYYQNLRRILLGSLLQHRKGTQVYAEYNMWLNSRGWRLQHYPLPESVVDPEILRLAMALRIRERWGARHRSRPRNAVYPRDRIVNG